jgi:hypothetical protein
MDNDHSGSPTGDPRPSPDRDNPPMPEANNVRAALARIDDDRSTGDWTEIEEAARWALHNLPDGMEFLDLVTRHPLNQVYFRAGLLACREYMARFVEQRGHPEIARSIRANWWPQLGDDPGAPRLFDFAELCDESEKPDGTPQWSTKPISISVEALPRAFRFLQEATP